MFDFNPTPEQIEAVKTHDEKRRKRCKRILNLYEQAEKERKHKYDGWTPRKLTKKEIRELKG